MLYQVMFSGNMHRDMETVLDMEQMQYIYGISESANFTGLTAYTDGSFLSFFEGDKDRIDASIEAHENNPSLSSIMVMATNDIEARTFSDFKIGLRYEDIVGTVGNFQHCFELTPSSLNANLPQDLPTVFKILFRTFAQVNQLRAG